MPGFDGTGPAGMGPMTGGGRGFCNPYGAIGTRGFVPPGRGQAAMYYRGGFGGGRGRRNMYYLTGLPGWMRGMAPGGPCAQYLLTGQWPTPQMQAAWQGMQAGAVAGPGGAAFSAAPGATREQELSMLKQHADWLKGQLDQISSRIAELESEQ
jgi:hypothetical protein